MSGSALLRFLDADLCGLAAAEIGRLLDGIVDEAGFNYFTLTRQPRPKLDPFDIVLAGRWPEGWPETYVRRKYAVIDPTIRYLGHCQRGFQWEEAVAAYSEGPHRRRVERMMSDARRFGLESGYVFPVHGRQGLIGILNVAGAARVLAPSQVAMLEAAARKALLSIIVPTIPACDIATSGERRLAMTRREMETLSLLAEGLTSNEIGSTLGLSAHTVDWYVNGIQQKLAARNRHHAVAIAFRMGLVS
jgi:Response regulator containing a CheY-like receiver domain and an HTH DNA-binding domain